MKCSFTCPHCGHTSKLRWSASLDGRQAWMVGKLGHLDTPSNKRTIGDATLASLNVRVKLTLICGQLASNTSAISWTARDLPVPPNAWLILTLF